MGVFPLNLCVDEGVKVLEEHPSNGVLHLSQFRLHIAEADETLQLAVENVSRSGEEVYRSWN